MVKTSFFVAPAENAVLLEGQVQSLKQSMIENNPNQTIDTNKIRLSTSLQQNSSSLTTIFAITNTMIGSGCLIIPMGFISCGIFTSIIIMAIICFINYATCSLYITYFKKNESDIAIQISKVIGSKYSAAYSLSSSILLYLVGIIYYIYMNSVGYPFICFILQNSGLTKGKDYVDPQINSQNVFNMFSIQIFGIIILVCIIPLLLLKDIKFIVKLAHGGISSLILYALFLVYILIDNIISGRLKDNLHKMNYFTTEISAVSGTFALAFMVHNVLGQIISTNIKQENNRRDLGIGYALAFLIYTIIGIFGAFGIIGRDAPINPHTITQYFDVSSKDYSQSVPPFIIELFFSVHLFTTLPILIFISKSQFFNVVYRNKATPKMADLFFCFTFVVVCFFLNTFNISPGIIVGIAGAVVGFLIVYVFPILLYFFDLRNKNEKKDSQIQLSMINDWENNTEKQPKKQINVIFIYCFYLSIVAIGIYLLIIQLIQIF